MEKKKMLHVKDGTLDELAEIAKHMRCIKCRADPPPAVTLIKKGVKIEDPMALSLLVEGVAPPPEGKGRAMVLALCASCAAILGIPLDDR